MVPLPLPDGDVSDLDSDDEEEALLSALARSSAGGEGTTELRPDRNTDAFDEEEADPMPSPSEGGDASDSDEEAFLCQLAQSLAGPPAKPCDDSAAAEDLVTTPSSLDVVPGPADWPMEVKSAVAAFLPWRELSRHIKISHGWRSLELSEALWKEYFRIQWPRLFHRKAAAHPKDGLPWRALFRQRWAEPDRHEDALKEDWNDFSAAWDLWKGSSLKTSVANGSSQKSLPEEQQIQHAIQRFKDDHLRLHGRKVPSSPSEPGAAEQCTREGKCRHLPVPIPGKLDGLLFVCERCADVHLCRLTGACDGAVLSDNNEFLVCTVSGRCSDPGRALDITTEDCAEGGAAYNEWDPELSAAQQHARWFEQGYFMSEEQADEYFDGVSSRKQRQRGRAQSSAGCSSGEAEPQAKCRRCC